MVCPRCSLNNPRGSLVCARCGERAPRPTGLGFETSSPPDDGPRRDVRRELQIDRRGRGLRTVGALLTGGPVRVRPPTWVRSARDRRLDPHPDLPPPPPRSRSSAQPAPSAQPTYVSQPAVRPGLHEAQTDPLWVVRPQSRIVNASAVPEPAVEPEPEELQEGVRRASLSRRLGAWVIDSGVVLGAVVISALLGLALYGPSAAWPHLSRGFDYAVDALIVGRGLGLAFVALWLVVSFAYRTLAHALCGQTLGKCLFGLRVVDLDGERPSFGDSAWRAVGGKLSFALGGVGLALAVFDRERLTLHDRLVGTRVVQE